MKSINIELYKQIAEKIKLALKEKNINQERIATRLNISVQQIQTYLNSPEKNKIPLDYLIEIANFLNISTEYFYKKDQNAIPHVSCLSESQASDLNIDKSKYQTVPVYSFAGAGKFVDLTEIEPIDTLIVLKEFDSKSIGVVKVIGKSMEPIIKDGSYVGIDTKNREPVQGYIYCVYLSYEGAVIKYIIKNREGIILKSENPMFDNIVVSKKELEDKDSFIIGRVKWVWQNI